MRALPFVEALETNGSAFDRLKVRRSCRMNGPGAAETQVTRQSPRLLETALLD